ncbi:MAG TPA: hypothetical protein VI356_08565 [Myxococcales bacterium]
MTRANLAAAVLSLAMTACAGATTQVQPTAAKQEAKKDAKPVASNDKKDIVCRMERPTGSNIPERVCRYVDLAPSEDTQRTQDMLRHEQGRSGPIQGN